MTLYGAIRLATLSGLAILAQACSYEPAIEPTAADAVSGSSALSDNAPTPPQGERTSTSEILKKSDIIENGKPGCIVEFTYAGHLPETLIWDGELCDTIKVSLADQSDLDALGKWERLDTFVQTHVREMAKDEVLYVEGEFTASIYPVGTTGQSYEVVVAD